MSSNSQKPSTTERVIKSKRNAPALPGSPGRLPSTVHGSSSVKTLGTTGTEAIALSIYTLPS